MTETEPWGRFMWEQVLRSADVLTGRQVQVGMLLASYGDADGSRVRPGLELLADDCRCSVSTVQRAVKALEVFGLLDRVTRGGGYRKRGGEGLATEYQLSVPASETGWDRLCVREPGKRRKLGLSGHQQPESQPVEPVEETTLRSPATGESAPEEGTLRSSAHDSPVTGVRLSGHPGDQVPRDHPRPDHSHPQPETQEQTSPEPTRAREDADIRESKLPLLGDRRKQRIDRTAEFRPLFTIGAVAFEGGVERHLAILVKRGDVVRDWYRGNDDAINLVRLKVHRALLAETLAARKGGNTRARRSA